MKLSRLFIGVFMLAAILYGQQPVAPGQISSVSGNGRTLVTTTGPQTNGSAVCIDANGNHVAGSCGGGGGGGAPSGPAGGALAGTYPNPSLATNQEIFGTLTVDDFVHVGTSLGVGTDAAIVNNLAVGNDVQIGGGLSAGAGKFVFDSASGHGFIGNVGGIDLGILPDNSTIPFPIEFNVTGSVTSGDNLFGIGVQINSSPVADASSQNISAINAGVASFGDQNVGTLVGQYLNVDHESSGSAGSLYGQWIAVTTGGVAANNAWGQFMSDMAGAATNSYYSWFDSQGVRRVKEDSTFDSVWQAIEALYNPLFAKYTPGATDFERIILGQWNGNVAEIGTEAGGTGTARGLRLIGPSVEVPNKMIVALHTPASSSEACTAGQFSDDASFHYVCVSTDTWKRVALSSF